MNVLTIRDMPEDFMREVVDLAMQLKEEDDRARDDLRGKVLISLYEKPSTRTRLSFETAMANLGGQSIVMDFNSSQISRGETLADTARVLSRYCHAISARLSKHSDLEELAKHSTVPVINALTDLEHPCQALADMQTIIEHGKDKGKLVFIGDAGDNVATSLMHIAARYGMHVVLCGPKGYLPKGESLESAWKSGAKVEITSDPVHAAKDADVIYTDVWVSMGEEAAKAERIEKLTPYQVNDELLKLAKPDCIVMHCLPAHRGQEITDSVLDGASATAVWDQAENRMWAQEALLLKLLGPGTKRKQREKPKKEAKPFWNLGLGNESVESEAKEEPIEEEKEEPEEKEPEEPETKKKAKKESKPFWKGFGDESEGSEAEPAEERKEAPEERKPEPKSRKKQKKEGKPFWDLGFGDESEGNKAKKEPAEEENEEPEPKSGKKPKKIKGKKTVKEEESEEGETTGDKAAGMVKDLLGF
jgi:ornithine carbamoyltransferase